MLAEDSPHPLDALVPDPSGMAPLCSQADFAALLENMVAGLAPRLFAIVHEYGDRVDAKCAAWGMAWDDRADAIGMSNTVHLGAPSPEALLAMFDRGSHITPRVVWVNPDPTPLDLQVKPHGSQ